MEVTPQELPTKRSKKTSASELTTRSKSGAAGYTPSVEEIVDYALKSIAIDKLKIRG